MSVWLVAVRRVELTQIPAPARMIPNQNFVVALAIREDIPPDVL